jgi:hypothetical protein
MANSRTNTESTVLANSALSASLAASNYPFRSLISLQMLARRASAFARSFATVVDSAGVKVAAVDNGQPTAAVTFLVKAGSRYEPKPGVAHALKNFAFKVRAMVYSEHAS